MFFVLKVSSDFCNDIAEFRRWAQRISNRKLLVMDESHMRIGEVTATTVVMPGESAYVVVDDNTSYAQRYDIIITINGERAFPCIIYTPEDRKRLKVDGIRAEMLIKFIDDILAQSVAALDEWPVYLLLDRSNIHQKERMMEAFRDRGCQNLVDIKFMPAKAAKRLSPLDNGFIHEWKERVRKRGPTSKNNIGQLMHDELHQIPANHIANYYRHSGLSGGSDPYADCTNPQRHHHARAR